MKKQTKKWLIKLASLVCILLLAEILKLNKINFIIAMLTLIYLDMAKEDF